LDIPRGEITLIVSASPLFAVVLRAGFEDQISAETASRVNGKSMTEIQWNGMPPRSAVNAIVTQQATPPPDPC
jgi:hypothetical protein